MDLFSVSTAEERHGEQRLHFVQCASVRSLFLLNRSEHEANTHGASGGWRNRVEVVKNV